MNGIFEIVMENMNWNLWDDIWNYGIWEYELKLFGYDEYGWNYYWKILFKFLNRCIEKYVRC